MKKDVELSYLAQETVAMDRLSPQAWCVMGNCFSLQKDHESALKFFQRALQLDSHFTYAHTLCGHEHVAMEDFEEGLTCYRNAIRMDPRHYNAWYGLGTIYFRQEKYKLAEFHFRRALHINSRSSVLHCYLGMALHTLKKNGEALELLEQAIVADPKNPLPKYQKANVLMSEERYHDALAELEQLKEVAPRESSVYFLMGKIYKRLDMLERAIYHFCIALDLKPSASDVNLIKVRVSMLLFLYFHPRSLYACV
jgi:anaphase-promoting complex subunit 3